MHYRNGREAKVGDHVVGRNYDGSILSGVVVTTNAQSDTCNLTIVPIIPGSMMRLTAKECLHADDAIPKD